MSDPITLPQPLFFTVAKGGTTTFVNAAHVVKIEIEAAGLSGGVLYLDDGSKVELGANEADWIMRLMSYHSHQQMQVVSAQKKLAGR